MNIAKLSVNNKVAVDLNQVNSMARELNAEGVKSGDVKIDTVELSMKSTNQLEGTEDVANTTVTGDAVVSKAKKKKDKSGNADNEDNKEDEKEKTTLKEKWNNFWKKVGDALRQIGEFFKDGWDAFIDGLKGGKGGNSGDENK